jgi:(R,R)-butanediol dehydrogenase/meso-butanediol dehydrogenase/diacetyl reductase
VGQPISSELHDGVVVIMERNQGRAALVAEVAGARIVERASGNTIRYAIDATGNINVLKGLIEAMEGGGAIGLVGISHGEIGLDPNVLVEREIALVGCHAFRDELPDAIALLPRLAAKLERFIDREIGLDDVPEAYRRLIHGDVTGLKTIIKP